MVAYQNGGVLLGGTNGAGDVVGNGCDYYVYNPTNCGWDDDDDFTSTDMCCACGGGLGGMHDDDDFTSTAPPSLTPTFPP